MPTDKAEENKQKTQQKEKAQISPLTPTSSFLLQLTALLVIYAELSGDFPLGDSRQPTYKSLRPF
ncbi:hypothetical protein EXD94_15780, partial [Acinetobacter pittii]